MVHGVESDPEAAGLPDLRFLDGVPDAADGCEILLRAGSGAKHRNRRQEEKGLTLRLSGTEGWPDLSGVRACVKTASLKASRAGPWKSASLSYARDS